MARIVLAFDSFKSCMSAQDACRAAAEGIASLGYPDLQISAVPLSDGGEGMLGILRANAAFSDAETLELPVLDAYFNPITAPCLIKDDTAYLESATICGIERAQKLGLDFNSGTSYGVGEMIAQVLERGISRVVLSLGGSATNDGGAGMAQALGVKFFDTDGAELETPVRVRDLERISKADFSAVNPGISGCRFEIPCDVKNPLLGPRGATYVFGPQKGGTPEDLKNAEHGMMRYSGAMAAALRDPIASVTAGAGAAGGLGAGCLYVLKARLLPGIETMLDLTCFDALMDDAALVLTGEGRSDASSCEGKVPSGVIRRALAHRVRTIVLSGSLGEGAYSLEKIGACGVYSISKGPTCLEEALADAPGLLSAAARSLVRTLHLSRVL